MRIGFIDDLLVFRKIVQQQLSILGHEVETYSCFEEFFEVIRTNPKSFQLVITDWYLGDRDAVKEGFVRSCRFYNYKGLLGLCSFLCSHAHHGIPATELGFDLFIDKANPNWHQTLGFGNTHSSKSSLVGESTSSIS